MQINWKSCAKIGLTAFALFLAIRYWGRLTAIIKLGLSAAWPLILGLCMAYAVNILMSLFEDKMIKLEYLLSRKKREEKLFSTIVETEEKISMTKRILSAIVAYMIIFLAIFAIISLVVPELISAIKTIIVGFPNAMKYITSNKYVVKYLPDVTNYLNNVDWKQEAAAHIKELTSGAGFILSGTLNIVSIITSTTVNIIIAIIFSLYILLGKEKLLKGAQMVEKKYVPEKAVKKINHILAALNTNFHNYIVGQCLEAIIIGSLCVIGMLIFRLPYAVMVGILVGATALIPVAGAYIGAGVGAFLIFTVSPSQALFFLIFIVVLQQLENNLIYPRVVGSSIGLPAIWVFAAVIIGGGMAGILGMMFGVPICAAVYQLVKEDVEKDQAGPNKNNNRRRNRNKKYGGYTNNNSDKASKAENKPNRPAEKKEQQGKKPFNKKNKLVDREEEKTLD